MSKVASITISARPRSSSYETSPTSPNAPKNGLEEENYQINDRQPRNAGITSSDSEEDRHIRRRGVAAVVRREAAVVRSSSSSSSSPERRRVTSQRNYDAYDQERGLIHAGRSGKMSSRQRTLERELNTEDPSFIASSDDALASSDDGLEDNFIPRKESGQFHHVKTSNGSDNDTAGSIYEKKNIEPPRAKYEPAGRRVKSATGKLLDNYAKDQSFDSLSEGEREIEKPKTSISILKAAYNKQAIETKPVERYKVDEELEQIRYTMQARGMMGDNDSDDGMKRQETEAEVLYRKPLSSIKDRFFAAASGRRVRSSSDSEDDAEEGTQKEEVVASPQKVTDMKDQWQSKGSWEDRNKINAREEIDTSQVGSARNVFKGLENRRDVISNVNRPRVNKIADPKQIMEARRQKTYGDVSEVDGIVRHEGQDELASVEFDVNQIKAAKHTFKTMEATGGNESKGLRRPSMKLIKQEDVRKTMDDHRRKVTAEDFDDYADHIKLDHQRDAEPYTNGDTVQQQEA